MGWPDAGRIQADAEADLVAQVNQAAPTWDLRGFLVAPQLAPHIGQLEEELDAHRAVGRRLQGGHEGALGPVPDAPRQPALR